MFLRWERAFPLVSSQNSSSESKVCEDVGRVGEAGSGGGAVEGVSEGGIVPPTGFNGLLKGEDLGKTACKIGLDLSSDVGDERMSNVGVVEGRVVDCLDGKEVLLSTSSGFTVGSWSDEVL